MSSDHNWRLTVLLVAHAQDDLGGPVVACDHVGGHHEVGACRASQSKVQDLERAVRLYHDVAGFQVLGQENGWWVMGLGVGWDMTTGNTKEGQFHKTHPHKPPERDMEISW